MSDAQPGTTVDPALLGIYLNDHLAGATGGLELARRAAASQRDKVLKDLAGEIAEDREALLRIMADLRVPVRHYKVYGAWAAEKAGRLKLNGRLRTRSPLSDLVELEGLRLGVEGKHALWAVVRKLADHDERLDTARLDDLLHRARRQATTLEELRQAKALDAFATA